MGTKRWIWTLYTPTYHEQATIETCPHGGPEAGTQVLAALTPHLGAGLGRWTELEGGDP